MYAIIETGGKQYKVEKDDIIDVELLASSSEAGEEVVFDHVLFFSDGKEVKVGAPFVTDSLVRGVLLSLEKGDKVIAFKYKQRKGIRRKVGHRQKYHRVKIIEIIG